MKLNRFGILLTVFCSAVIALALIAFTSLQPSLAQIPTTSATASPFAGLGTVTPLFTGRTATPAPKIRIPTRQPRPTEYAGPTITPSGPLVAINTNQPAANASIETDGNRILALYTLFPKTVGALRTIINKPDFAAPMVTFGLESPDSTEYGVEIYFHNSAHSAYLQYQRVTQRMMAGKSVDIGDAGYIATQDRLFTAAMQYRNVFVSISSGTYINPSELPKTLTEQQLTDILTAILKALQQL